MQMTYIAIGSVSTYASDTLEIEVNIVNEYTDVFE